MKIETETTIRIKIGDNQHILTKTEALELYQSLKGALEITDTIPSVPSPIPYIPKDTWPTYPTPTNPDYPTYPWTTWCDAKTTKTFSS